MAAADPQSILKQLTACASSESPDLSTVTSLLTSIKLLALTSSDPSLPSINRSALECGVVACLKGGDLEGFERNMNQLKAQIITERGGEREKILGLNLMHRLCSGELSSFHSDLELLTHEDKQHPFIAFPIKLEQWLMVGSYDLVLSASSALPHPLYGHFMGELVQAVRENIAECCEVSYNRMSLEKAGRMMMFQATPDLLRYIEEFHSDWVVDAKGETIEFMQESPGLKKEDVRSDAIIQRALAYANELERIV